MTAASYSEIKERFFVCSCGKDRQRMADELRAEVRFRLAKGNKKLKDKDLLSRVVYDLEWQFDAHITGIYCDQWCGVQAERQVYEGVYPDGKRVVTDEVFIDCDRVEDGVAAVWKYFADKYPRRDA